MMKVEEEGDMNDGVDKMIDINALCVFVQISENVFLEGLNACDGSSDDCVFDFVEIAARCLEKDLKRKVKCGVLFVPEDEKSIFCGRLWWTNDVSNGCKVSQLGELTKVSLDADQLEELEWLTLVAGNREINSKGICPEYAKQFTSLCLSVPKLRFLFLNVDYSYDLATSVFSSRCSGLNSDASLNVFYWQTTGFIEYGLRVRDRNFLSVFMHEILLAMERGEGLGDVEIFAQAFKSAKKTFILRTKLVDNQYHEQAYVFVGENWSRSCPTKAVGVPSILPEASLPSQVADGSSSRHSRVYKKRFAQAASELYKRLATLGSTREAWVFSGRGEALVISTIYHFAVVIGWLRHLAVLHDSCMNLPTVRPLSWLETEESQRNREKIREELVHIMGESAVRQIGTVMTDSYKAPPSVMPYITFVVQYKKYKAGTNSQAINSDSPANQDLKGFAFQNLVEKIGQPVYNGHFAVRKSDRWNTIDPEEKTTTTLDLRGIFNALDSENRSKVEPTQPTVRIVEGSKKTKGSKNEPLDESVDGSSCHAIAQMFFEKRMFVTVLVCLSAMMVLRFSYLSLEELYS